MSLDDLDQALLAAKWGGAPAHALDLIAEVLELPRGVVERVLYAAWFVTGDRDGKRLGDEVDDGPSLPEELRQAIREAMERGVRKMMVRRKLENGNHIMVRTQALIGKDYARICGGCPFSLRCVNEGISTPRKCARGGGVPGRLDDRDGMPRLLFLSGAEATVLRMDGDKIRIACTQPRGEWTVDVMDVLP